MPQALCPRCRNDLTKTQKSYSKTGSAATRGGGPWWQEVQRHPVSTLQDQIKGGGRKPAENGRKPATRALLAQSDQNDVQTNCSGPC